MRLQKLLAEAGLGSRRQIEAWIQAARVSVNGRIARLGDRAAPGDTIRIDDKPVVIGHSSVRVLAYHKPAGEIVTRNDPQGRSNVFARLPHLAHGKWVTVGRLDYNTSGLLLLTNSGDLANRLMHPRYAVERTYSVRIQGALGPADLERLRQGVEIGDGPAAFESIEAAAGEGSNRWYRVGLREGRNREVRRMFDAVDRRVSRLIRVQYGTVVLPRDLDPGAWRELDAREIVLLEAAPKPFPRTRPAVVRQGKIC